MTVCKSQCKLFLARGNITTLFGNTESYLVMYILKTEPHPQPLLLLVVVVVVVEIPSHKVA